MIKYILTIYLLFLICTVQAQTAPAIQWQNAIGGKHSGYVTNMSPTNDGGYIAVGYVDSLNGSYLPNFHPGDEDVWVAKLDAHCNIIWQKCYGSKGADYANIVHQTKDGGDIIGGMPGTNDGDVSGNHGGGDIWVIKLSDKGDLQWQKCLGGSKDDGVYSIIQTKDDGYILAGQTKSDDGDVKGFHFVWPYLNDDGWVVKLDSIGKIEWQKCLGGIEDDAMFDVLQNDDGSYMVAGYTVSNDGDVRGNHGGPDSWVVKLSDKGAIVWQKCYGGSKMDFTRIIKKTFDGGYILGGETTSNDGEVSGNHGGSGDDDWLLRIDSIGNILWQNCYGGSDLENLFSLETTKDNGSIFCGTTRSDDGDIKGFHGYMDYWTVKLDSAGKIEWQRCLGGIVGGQAYNVYQIKDGGFIIGGMSGAQAGDGDVTVHYNMDSVNISDNWWIVKLAFEPKAIHIIYSNNQLNIYPNPAHNSIGIETDNVKEIRILDAAGKLYLHKQINTYTNIYTYLNIQYLAKGVYIVQAIGNDGNIKVGELMVE